MYDSERPQAIITIRHGHYERSAESDDCGLSDRGKEQIHESSKRLREVFDELAITWAVIQYSPYRRAAESARIIHHSMRTPHRMLRDSDLRERELGDLNPRDMMTDPRFDGSHESALYWVPEGGGESLNMLRKGRLLESVERGHIALRQRRGRSALVIVAHGGVNHAFLPLFTEMSDAQLTHGPLVSGSSVRALQDPGHITNGQLHIYTPAEGSPQHSVRTIGVDPAFYSGIIQVHHGDL